MGVSGCALTVEINMLERTIITMLTIATILGNIHEWHHARRGGGYFCYVKYEIVRKDRFIVTGREGSQNIHIWVTSSWLFPHQFLNFQNLLESINLFAICWQIDNQNSNLKNGLNQSCSFVILVFHADKKERKKRL